MFRVLFVCTGNICRSPTAEGVFRHVAHAEGFGAKIEADSAGTHGYHVGDPPDPRTIAVAAARGFDLADLRARRVTRDDFHRFDLIIAMDQGHYDHLEALRPEGARAEVKLFLDYLPGNPERDPRDASLKDVPDPYYGDRAGFEHVLDLVEQTSHALLKKIRTRYL